MPVPTFPVRAAAALFLERQHLEAPRSRPLTPARLLRFAEDTGGIQLDSVNVVDRAHYLAVWSRFGPYDRRAFDRLVHRHGHFFEYWAHAACLVPVSAMPAWRRAMRDYHIKHQGWARWLQKNARVLKRVRETIAANGPMSGGDFDSKRPGGKGWWSWSPVHHALHHLWMTGALTVASRKHFAKRFDLLERAVPAARGCEPVSSEEFARWHVTQSLHAMGAATEKDLGWYLSFPRSFRTQRIAAIRDLIARGDVAETAVEGQPGRWLALTRDLPALRRAARLSAPSRGTTLLTPFDSLLWHRERVQRLFGFEYKIELYTPGDSRVHGYYTLPVLHEGELIGRIDAKTHREDRVLEVRHASFEPWFAKRAVSPSGGIRLDVDQAMAGLADSFASLATFVGAETVKLDRVTPAKLKPALARKLREKA
ncbi:MAG TPA: crosslink repair DNA glycosylase YcaQ family protein [Thermoanaerobaculia bacterium]